MVQEGLLLLVYALTLMKGGLYCNLLVKTAQKGFPRELLNNKLILPDENMWPLVLM